MPLPSLSCVAVVAVPRWCCPLVLPVPCSRLCSCRLCRCLFLVVSSFSLSRCAVRLCLVHLVASLSSVPLVPLVCSSCRRVVRLGSVVHHPSFHPSLRPFLHLSRTSRPACSAARHHPYFIPFTSPCRSPASPLTPSPPDPPPPTHLTQPLSFHPPSPFHRHTSPPHHLRQPPPLRHSLSTSPHPESAAPPPFHRHTSPLHQSRLTLTVTVATHLLNYLTSHRHHIPVSPSLTELLIHPPSPVRSTAAQPAQTHLLCIHHSSPCILILTFSTQQNLYIPSNTHHHTFRYPTPTPLAGGRHRRTFPPGSTCECPKIGRGTSMC